MLRILERVRKKTETPTEALHNPLEGARKGA